jgi:hypothetical protein
MTVSRAAMARFDPGRSAGSRFIGTLVVVAVATLAAASAFAFYQLNLPDVHMARPAIDLGAARAVNFGSLLATGLI